MIEATLVKIGMTAVLGVIIWYCCQDKKPKPNPTHTPECECECECDHCNRGW